MRDLQVPYARQGDEVASWRRDGEGRIGLAEVVARTRPTMLIGTSTQPGVFSQDIVTEMAAHTGRPVIMPLSNPNSLSEAQPADLIAGTGGRALIATGSPFDPGTYHGVRYQIAQANNALIFPGLGLGSPPPGPAGSATACCRRDRCPGWSLGRRQTRSRGAASVTSLREVSAAVATAVARAEGLAQVQLNDPGKQVAQAMWTPAYPTIQPHMSR